MGYRVAALDLARGTDYKVPTLIRIATHAAGALTEALFGAVGESDDHDLPFVVVCLCS